MLRGGVDACHVPPLKTKTLVLFLVGFDSYMFVDAHCVLHNRTFACIYPKAFQLRHHNFRNSCANV